MNLYFRDNFFNAGVTEILNEREENAGQIDLKSAFGSAIEVYGPDGEQRSTGGFRFFSNRWEVAGATGELLGVLRSRMSLFSKKFTYETEGRGDYDITSPVFSREYEISDESRLVASFRQVNGWLSGGAYVLDNQSDVLDSYELVAVIMGMHAIQKRRRAAANSSS